MSPWLLIFQWVFMFALGVWSGFFLAKRLEANARLDAAVRKAESEMRGRGLMDENGRFIRDER